MALAALPSKKKPHQLPERIHTQTAWHNRVILKMTLKKPQIRIQIKFSNNFAFSVFAAFIADMRDTIKHQHWRQWKLCVAGTKHPTVAAVKQFLVCETFLHDVLGEKTQS